MSHNLSASNGSTEMMYAGEPPWHRLGTRLDEPVTAEEAIASAGLDWTVELTPIATYDGLTVPAKRAVVRYDRQEVLGVVSDRYVPVQNRSAFSFLDALVTEGKMLYHTAGAIGKGERIWMLAQMPEQIRVKQSDDLVDQYLLLSNCHDGSGALRVLFTPIRVVCQNTLSLALSQGQGQGISVMHKGNLEEKIRQAQEILGFAAKFYDHTATEINRLAEHYPTENRLDDYFRELYPDPKEDRESTRTNRIREELHRLFEEGRGHDLPEIRHTTWVAFNAVTEYVDHVRPTRGSGNRDRSDNRLNSIWFGSGARLKQRAWDLALEMASEN